MNTRKAIIAALLAAAAIGAGAQTPPDDAAAEASLNGRADRRLAEMLDRMQAAVEEVARLYGNPTFLQVFTNDAARADDLRLRLKAAGSLKDLQSQVQELQRRREELQDDIALKTRESVRLADRLARQRSALDSVAKSVDLARRAVEDTAK